MARQDRVLALDIGAASIKAGEFEYSASGGVTLVGFAIKDYSEELTENNRADLVASLVRGLIQEKGFTAKKVLISISGQYAFIRFVKLPPVSEEEKRIRQIVEFEARQNVPFPMDEVLWDYQLIATGEADEMDVMFVVIKNEIVEQITHAVQSIGLKPVLVDIAPVACYNAARANHVGDDECAIVLNIGARSCNLLFADRTRFFARTIPIAGHAITQQIGKEFNIGPEEAEELKRRHGFVALGGAYEAPESEVAATVSKIVRSVMTRLHGEVNRSISVYLAQQKGNRPTRLYLAGGSSIMSFCDRFFNDTLGVEVSYLNPFQVVSFHPSVDLEKLQESAHLFSEVVGLGLRYRIQCPVEISLIPDAIRKQQVLDQKKPYFVACALFLLLVGFLGMFAEEYKVARYRDVHEDFASMVAKLESIQKDIKGELAKTDAGLAKYDSVLKVLRQREQLPQILNEIQRLKPTDVWLTKLTPVYAEMKAVGTAPAAAEETQAGPDMGPGMMMPGMMMPGPGMMFDPGAAFGGGGGGGPTVAGGKTGAESFRIHGFIVHGHSVAARSVAIDRGDGAGVPPQEKTGVQKPASAPGVPGAEGAGESDAANPAASENATPAGEGAAPAKEPVPDAGTAAAAAPVPGAVAPPGQSPAATTDDTSSTPEQVFLDRLRNSELIDNSPTMTGISSYTPSDNIRNLATFTMQIKLKKPLEVSR